MSTLFRCGHRVMALGVVLAVLPPSFGAARYRVTNLESLGFATATALNDRGQIAGTSADGHLLFWDGTRTLDLGTAGTGFAHPTDLNNAGQIVGYMSTESTPRLPSGRAFLYSDGQFVNLNLGLLTPNAARAINDAGQVIGDFERSGVPMGGFFRYDHGTVTFYVDDWPMTIASGRTSASAINRTGDIAGTLINDYQPWSEHWVSYGFRRSADGYHLLGNLESTPGRGGMGEEPSSSVLDMNDAGVLVGRATSDRGGTVHGTPFLFSEGRMLDLEDPADSNWMISLKLNNLGLVAGGADATPPKLWSGGVKLNLGDLIENWAGPGSVWNVTALNDRGQILAHAYVDNHYVVALLTPLPSTSRFVNLSARAVAGSGSQTFIAGFVLGGHGDGSVLIRTSGPALKTMGVDTAADDPALKLFDRTGAERGRNDNWPAAADPAQLTATALRLGAFPLADDSKDAALLARLPAAGYSVHAAAENASRIVLTEIYDAGAETDAPLINASMRLHVGVGEAIGIVGFVIVGDGPRTLLIRAVGPSLAGQGVTGVLANPQLQLYREHNFVMGNDDWGSAATTPLLADTAKQVGAFALPDGSHDAALLIQVEPGVYSVHVNGVGDTTGVALVELYLVP